MPDEDQARLAYADYRTKVEARNKEVTAFVDALKTAGDADLIAKWGEPATTRMSRFDNELFWRIKPEVQSMEGFDVYKNEKGQFCHGMFYHNLTYYVSFEVQPDGKRLVRGVVGG